MHLIGNQKTEQAFVSTVRLAPQSAVQTTPGLPGQTGCWSVRHPQAFRHEHSTQLVETSVQNVEDVPYTELTVIWMMNAAHLAGHVRRVEVRHEFS